MNSTMRYYHRMGIEITLYGMSWQNLWDREKRAPTLRDIINRVKWLESMWFYSEYLPSIKDISSV